MGGEVASCYSSRDKDELVTPRLVQTPRPSLHLIVAAHDAAWRGGAGGMPTLLSNRHIDASSPMVLRTSCCNDILETGTPESRRSSCNNPAVPPLPLHLIVNDFDESSWHKCLWGDLFPGT